MTITDTVRFSSNQTFGTALIIPDSWKQVDENTLFIFTLDGSVRVDIETREIPFTINTTIINEQSIEVVPQPQTRLANNIHPLYMGCA